MKSKPKLDYSLSDKVINDIHKLRFGQFRSFVIFRSSDLNQIIDYFTGHCYLKFDIKFYTDYSYLTVYVLD